MEIFLKNYISFVLSSFCCYTKYISKTIFSCDVFLLENTFRL